jgi:hypothetical protein
MLREETMPRTHTVQFVIELLANVVLDKDAL